ncbi:hypothetical protein PRA67_25050, partial [Klebsiella pneumoniae]|nr:hypothetical protein [Klebsiella pneumoniae]
ACVLPENPASYRVVRTKSYLFNKAVIGQPSDHELCIDLLSRLPVGYRAMFVNLMGHQDLQEMSGDGNDKGNSETKTVLH